jgi:tripartite-type tricarboxylate transporter receptor subunit TctC
MGMERHTRVRTSAGAALAVLALLAASCGGGDAAQEGGTTGSEAESGESGSTSESEAAGGEASEPEAAGGDSGYPSQDITMVVGRSAGGGHDEYARLIAPLLEEALGATVVISNVEGAGGRVAAGQVLAAEPDGHTIHLMEPNGLAAFQVLGAPEYDLAEFTPLGIVNDRPSTFAVAANSEIETWEDLVAAGSEELSFATAGLTSPNFVNGAIAAEAAGINFVPVPHEGSSEAITSIVRGDTDFTVFSGDSIAESVESGDLRALVQFGSEPLEDLADVPQGADVGLEQFDGVLTTNLVLVAPPGLPDDVEQTLTDAVQEVLNGEELAQIAEETNRLVQPGTPEETSELFQRSLETYREFEPILSEYLEL